MSKEPLPNGNVSFCLDGASVEIPRAKDGTFFVRATNVLPGRHICSFMIGGGFGWGWKVELKYGAAKPLRRHGILGYDYVAERSGIVLDVPDV